MSSQPNAPISLSLACDPAYARLVRMTAANVAMLSSMSVERVEDIRMAAEEAFIYACSTDAPDVSLAFDVDDKHVGMTVSIASDTFEASDPEDQTQAYAELILAGVCDSYQKLEGPARLVLSIEADV